MLLGGLHRAQLRLAGFGEKTVPALRLDGRRVQGSMAIMRALDEAVPDPSLYPDDADARRAVEAAEQWGNDVLQPVPRRLIRRALTDDYRVRRWFSDVASPLPLPSAGGVALKPIAWYFARLVDANRARTDADRAGLEDLLTRVDELIADGVIGDPAAPNAADFQIAPSVRMLGAFGTLRAQVANHPSADGLARRIVPEYPDIPA
jgi:glutathione S-transferase